MTPSPGGNQIPPFRGAGGAAGGGRVRGAGGPHTILDDEEERVERLLGFLVITASREEEEWRYFRLQKGVNWIGAIGSRAQIELRDREVSGQHAIIVCTNTAARLLDLDSSNGTHLNGNRVEYGQLSLGDVIRVGRTDLTYIPFEFVAED